MNFNFELILFYATLITGVIALADILYFSRRRGSQETMPRIFDYSRSFFPVLLIVFILRSFLFEPYRIPSGSLEPTLLKGDFLLVNKFAYGIRLPVTHTKILDYGTPKRGDIVVFRWPPNPSYSFIKRLIGLPGDHVSYNNKELTINGKKIPQTFLQTSLAFDQNDMEWEASENEEDLLGVKHHIYLNSNKYSTDFDVTVPEGMYLMMGDNRDDSADSRYFGFVPDKNIVGKASLVWLSWNNRDTNLRWNRMGSLIN